ncbi:MAG: gliding motility-associated C-terminal domain-containing protein [Cytophagaceae bacterium]|jgi:hypothetical protein|nr:gliding motility-associated C-terminal domain-containing protein [Cytophagaceae bacterium]
MNGIKIYIGILFLLLSALAGAQVIKINDPNFATALCSRPETVGAMRPGCDSLDAALAAAVTGKIQLQNGNINDISELIYFNNINFIQMVNNNITSLPNLSSFPNLKFIDLRGNPWVSIEQDLAPVKTQLQSLELRRAGNSSDIKNFSFLNQYVNLKKIQLTNFNAEILPDFSNYTGLTHIIVTSNKLSFEDLLPITQVPSGLYRLFPQKALTNDTTLTVKALEDFELTIPIDQSVPGVEYRFYKDDVLLPHDGSATLRLDKPTSKNAGVYKATLHYNHALFGDSSLTTGNYVLKFVDEQEGKDLFTPNEDGNADEFYIEGSGEAVIYNKQGQVIRRLSLPAYWDGKDQKGNAMPPGVYTLEVPEQKVRKISLLR